MSKHTQTILMRITTLETAQQVHWLKPRQRKIEALYRDYYRFVELEELNHFDWN